jgi:predicted O-linked N-acetylglucosamine transferase (SPINDLY family)
MDSDRKLRSALQDHQAGRFADAERVYRQILAENPRHADALNLLGVVCAQTGRFESSAQFFRRAIEVHPSNAEYHYNLGNALRDQGLADDAIGAYRKAIALDPKYAAACNNLGNLLRGQGKLEEAIQLFGEAVRLKPDYLDAHLNMGVAYRQQGYLDKAMACYRTILQIKPDHLRAHFNFGVALREKGLYDLAIAAFQRAISLKPDYAEAYSNLGSALRDKGSRDEAIEAYRRAIELNPDLAEAQSNLGISLSEKGMVDEAIAAYREALRLQPTLPAAHSNLAGSLRDTGRMDLAIEEYQRSVDLDPGAADLHSNLLYAIAMDAGRDPQRALAEHRLFSERHAAPFRGSIKPHQNDPDPDRRIRVGYVSPDFYSHPVGRFMLPMLRDHDHEHFQFFCYSSGQTIDDLTARIRKQSDVWRDIRNVPDADAAKLVREDQIDILIDLTMHTACNRLLMFARKPAPIQAIYLAYPGTTGLETMDYRITDIYMDPPGTNAELYSEENIHVNSYWCYHPLVPELQTKAAPMTRKGYVTFGCLNSFAKVSEEAIRTWGSILAAVQHSHLQIHSKAGQHRQRVLNLLAESGATADRVEFIPMQPFLSYMDQYGEIDVGLDTFPYAGGTTTCDAVWMGVPMVTLAGRTAIARAGVSILSNIGLPELIARSPEDYARIAIELARDPARLNELRNGMRKRMESSRLMDSKTHVREMEGVYREMWRRWCAKKRGGH